MRILGFYLRLRMHTMLADEWGTGPLETIMTVQSTPAATARQAADAGLAVLAAATVAWVLIAIAGWNWVNLAERLLEFPGLRTPVQEWAYELMSPDGLMRRAIRRTTRG